MKGKTFALDVSKFVAKANAAPKLVVRKVAGDMLAKVVLRTPVGDPSKWKSPAPAGYVGGRLRANWNTSIGGPDLSTTVDTDASGSAVVARGQNVLRGVDGERDVYIMNSLPYVRRIEYEGWSSQARAGMVRVTVAEFQTFVNKAVRSLPK
jgi:hypothetical protein